MRRCRTLSVIPGLVPGTNRGSGGNLGPRDKPGDDAEGSTVTHVDPNAITLDALW